MNASNQDPAGELLLKEVDDDLRREQYLQFWRRYGKFAIVGAIVIVIGVAGHQAWLGWREGQFQRHASAFAAVQDLIKIGKQSEALASLAQIAGGKNGGFTVAAGFQRAQLQLEAGDNAAAIASYDALSQSDAPPILRDLALLKSAMLSLESDDPDMLARKLQPLSDPKNPWHSTAIEMLAVLAGRRGDTAQAITYYRQLADDLAAPQTIRARATEMLAVLGGPGVPASLPQKG